MAGGDLRGEDMVFPAVLWAHIIRNAAQLYPVTIPYSSVKQRWLQGLATFLRQNHGGGAGPQIQNHTHQRNYDSNGTGLPNP